MVYAVETVLSHEEIRFDLTKTDPSPLEPGEKFDIWIDATNIEIYTIRNLKISFVNSFPFSITDLNQSSIIIDELRPGEKKTIKFNVKINKDINEGMYSLNLQYYSSKLSAVVSKNFDLSIKTINVIVSTTNIRLNPEKARPGSTANLEIDIINNANSAITDITAELMLDGTPFASIGESNEKKIRQLAQGAKATLTYDLAVNPDAALKVHKVPLSITYYDQLGSKFTRNNTIGITVYAKPEYNIDLESSDVFIKDQNGEITISIANKGNSDLKFLSVELLPGKDYDIISNPRNYVGNLDSDDFETVTYKIYTRTSKPAELKFKIDYKDTYNNDFSDNLTVNFPLYSKWAAQNLGLVKRNMMWIDIIAGLVLIIFLYKFYKVWRFERDIERSLITLYRNAMKWLRVKLKL